MANPFSRATPPNPANAVVVDVAPTPAARLDVVVFRCWFGAGITTGPVTPPATVPNPPGSFYLYLDARFATWLEVVASDVISQFVGPDPQGATMVWVRRDAVVKYGEVATAVEFADRFDADPNAGTYPKRH